MPSIPLRGRALLWCLLLAIGLSASGTWLGQGPLMTGVPLREFLLGSGGLFALLATARFGEALQEANLPEGGAIWRKVFPGILWTLVGFAAALILIWGRSSAASALVAAVCWLWLMHRNFYLDSSLERAPMFGLLLRHVLWVPLCAFPFLLVQDALASDTIGFALMIIGASFGFEICRRREYSEFYGRWRLIPYLVFSAAWTLAGAAKLGLLPFATFGVAVLGAGYLAVLLHPKAFFGWAKFCAGVAFLIQAYAYAAQRLLEC